MFHVEQSERTARTISPTEARKSPHSGGAEKANGSNDNTPPPTPNYLYFCDLAQESLSVTVLLNTANPPAIPAGAESESLQK